MAKFSIEYNPYLVTLKFKKNGKELGANSKFMAKRSQRLQVLMNKSSNWDGLVEEIVKVCNDREIELDFRGRRIDFEDLEYCIKRYKGEEKFVLNFEECANDGDLLTQLDELIESIKESDIPEFNEKNEEGKDIFDAYEEAKNGVFEVSVIATMSSGKSTLINSLLHTELLPSENKACTATIARIFDCDDMDTWEAECYAADDETIIYPRTEVTSDMLREYNSDEKVQFINIEGNIPAVEGDKIQLCLRDTPGPNNSRNENHGRLTSSIIRQTNAVVLYVMNATQIGIKDDKNLLHDISNEMKRAGKQSRDRFIFVINKCDALDEEKGETIDKLLADVEDYLKQFGITEPTLIPTTARMALLIRKNKKGDSLTRQEKNDLTMVDDFVESELLYYEKYATLTPGVRTKLETMVKEYHENEDLWDDEALIHTGVPAVEETIREYIAKYAYPMKINDAVKDINMILSQIDMETQFDKKLAEDKENLKRIQQQIDDAQKKYESSKQIYEDYKEKIEELKLEQPDKKEEQRTIEKELSRLAQPYESKTKVDKTEADNLINQFTDSLIGFQMDCESRLNRELDQNIFGKCTDMLEEYQQMVLNIISDIEIEGFKFEKCASFVSLRIDNLNELKKENEKIRYKTVTKWKKNPEREGFWGKLKFWKPKEISYESRVKDGVDVDVSNIVVDIMSQLSRQMKENVENLFAQAEIQIDVYKTMFLENIDNLDNEIKKILSDLREKTTEEDAIKLRVQENQELEEWVTDKIEKLENILDF